MKKIFLITALFIGLISFSQTKAISVNWKGFKELQTESFKIDIPFFDNKNSFNFDLDRGLLFTQQWSSGSSINSNSVTVANVQYAPISVEELKDLKQFFIPEQLQFSIGNAIDRTKVSNVVEFSPIVKLNGVYQKVISIRFDYSNANSSASKSLVSQSVSNSVLSSGTWYKFAVDKSGVHIIDKNFLNQLGLNTSGVNPRNIKIYGNGGFMMPYINSDTEPIDPTENAIKIVGEQDGVFNDSDYILFYAEGPNGENPDSNTFLNIYNNETYYYITVSQGLGKRILPYVQPAQPSEETLTSFIDTKYHEKDEENLAFVGRRWFGDNFNIETQKQFRFNFPNLVTSEPVAVKVIGASASDSASSLALSIDGVQQSNLNFIGVSNGNSLVNEAVFQSDITATSDNIVFDFQYDNFGNPISEGFLDYISVKATRELKFYNRQFNFKPNKASQASNVATLVMSEASALKEIWEVSDLFNVKTISNPDLDTVTFKSALSANQEFVAVSNTDFYRPRILQNSFVYNQNIKGTIFKDNNGNFQDIDYLILTPTSHLSQANRLAQINRDAYGLRVKVATLQSIYNEFNTGNPDITAIRNFVRYVYTNATNDANRLRYLCLFGDASFDYKGRIAPNTYNFPLWNALSSFNLTTSFVSDDFYGLMDLGEGNFSATDRLDLAVGRIVADTPLKAKQMVDKVKQYHEKGSLGNWRNNVVVMSDDVDEDWEADLQATTDEIGNTILHEKPFINVKKIHTDAFQQQSSAGGDRYPAVTSAIKNEAELGASVMIYFGHGGEDGLGSERFYSIGDVVNLRNTCKYHCFITVTCEYTKFDNPVRLTAGEYTYWNPQGGAIGLVTTTREIFVPVGTAVNIKLSEFLFSYNPTDNFGPNEYPSIAEALRLTKNDPSVSGTQQKLLIFSIGDPALKLTIPKPNVVLTKVNDELITAQTEPLAALGYAKMEGEVQNEQGSLLTNYNGVLTTTIFDKDVQRTTLANDGTTENGALIKLDFENLGPVIYRGQASVVNGKFSFEFIVPRDIAVPVGNGRVSFYAIKENSLEDKSGSSVDELKIGGINPNAPEDNVGPEIVLHINDKNFVSGGITNEEPLLLASFKDENGINTASGIGHDITAIIDGDEVNPYVLNDYYLTEVDDYTKGNLDFKFRDLKPGLHTLTLKAWDVYNNSSTAEIEFNVFDKNETLVIDNVLNYPNPFINYTEFWFTHNSSAVLDISVQIFTVSGKLVRTLNGQTNSNGLKSAVSSTSRDIVWDGKDDFGEKIGKGTYVYKIKVHSSALNKTVEKIEKLVILQ